MTMLSRFPGQCAACGERFKAGAPIDWTRGVGARHATDAQCIAAKAAHNVTRPSLDLRPIAQFLQAARDRGLKAPKLRVLALDGRSELRIKMTAAGIAPGSIAVTQDGAGFLGCVRPNGDVVGALAANPMLQHYLVSIAKEPAQAAKAYAALMCRCSFCGLPLTDAGSVEVGYGPVCAKSWNLPHTSLGTPTLFSIPQASTNGVA
jgi:Family of unknown function (DUF6011)